MSHEISKTLDTTPARARERAMEALSAEGFGVLTEIDVQRIQDVYGRLRPVNLMRDTFRGHIFGVFVGPDSGPRAMMRAVPRRLDIHLV